MLYIHFVSLAFLGIRVCFLMDLIFFPLFDFIFTSIAQHHYNCFVILHLKARKWYCYGLCHENKMQNDKETLNILLHIFFLPTGRIFKSCKIDFKWF